jgi:hypothetical protein
MTFLDAADLIGIVKTFGSSSVLTCIIFCGKGDNAGDLDSDGNELLFAIKSASP